MGAVNMFWAFLLVQVPVDPSAGGILCLAPRQAADLHGHSSLGTWLAGTCLGFWEEMGHVDGWEGWETT